MAFGLRCAKCGFQEGSHDFEDHWCRTYTSPDPRREKQMWAEERSKWLEKREAS